MKTRYSGRMATNVAPRRAGGTTRRVGLWVAQVVVAAMFLMAGASKFAGAAAMIALFDAIGIGQWFRYVTATIEVAAGVMLLVPTLAVYGALALVITMLCAVATHVFIIGGSLVPPLALLAGSVMIAWARRDELAPLQS
jgi:putative oxidoreductase